MGTYEFKLPVVVKWMVFLSESIDLLPIYLNQTFMSFSLPIRFRGSLARLSFTSLRGSFLLLLAALFMWSMVTTQASPITTSGPKTVTVTATDMSCTTVATVLIEVRTLPDITIFFPTA